MYIAPASRILFKNRLLYNINDHTCWATPHKYAISVRDNIQGLSSAPQAFTKLLHDLIKSFSVLPSYSLGCAVVCVTIDFEIIADIGREVLQSSDNVLDLAFLDIRAFDSIPRIESYQPVTLLRGFEQSRES